MNTYEQDKDLYRCMRRFKAAQPVRKEQTGERNLDFSTYIREHCRPSKCGCFVDGIEYGGFVYIDLDGIILDYHYKQLQLLEVKTRGGRLQYAQRRTLEDVDKLLRYGSESPRNDTGLTYRGFHTLVLQNTTPLNSEWMRWDDQQIDAHECWRRINMLDAIERSVSI